MDEAQRIDTDHGRTASDGSFGREGDSQSSGTSPTSILDKAKDQIEPGMDKAKEQVDAGIDKAAEGLESTADRIKSMTGESDSMPAQAGVKLAEGMEGAASYLKEHSSDEMLKDLEVFVKEHPTQALVGAIFAGFMVGRMMR